MEPEELTLINELWEVLNRTEESQSSRVVMALELLCDWADETGHNFPEPKESL